MSDSLDNEGLEMGRRDNRAEENQARTRPPSASLPKVRPAGDELYTITNSDIDAILMVEEQVRIIKISG